MSIKWMTGLFFIVIVCILWTGASYLTQFIYADLSFQSPFLFTYLSSSFFALYLPFWQLCVRMGWVIDPPSQHGIKRRNKSYIELQQEQDASDHGQGENQSLMVSFSYFYSLLLFLIHSYSFSCTCTFSPPFSR